jgi:Mg2+ and Co2+ transporter CorA
MLAKKSQSSTERMEQLTDSMHVIAKKTERETVSMKIITLVTLFFLPGTFISVSFLFIVPKS